MARLIGMTGRRPPRPFQGDEICNAGCDQLRKLLDDAEQESGVTLVRSDAT